MKFNIVKTIACLWVTADTKKKQKQFLKMRQKILDSVKCRNCFSKPCICDKVDDMIDNEALIRYEEEHGRK